MQIKTILATDCGSTTTKARFFKKIDNEYRFVCSGEAPTTVETPYEDVTLGVRNAVREVEELSGYTLLDEKGIITPNDGNKGVDIYITTSSAGGGLQMMVFGVMKHVTAESAERAALGAGAIVMDVVSSDDGRPVYEKIREIRYLRPDMILFAGGTDGGNITHTTELAEILASADPKARLGEDYTLPIIFAGNKDAREIIKKTLREFTVTVVDNIRPKIDLENVFPARGAIHECFMEHVMSHAPGYNKLMKWTETPIQPTPMAEGIMMLNYSNMTGMNVIGVGLGGATTNVYSVYEGRFVRTVSANLGMSYSICNVLKEAGLKNIKRWIPFDIGENELINMMSNKMIRPTTLPQTLDELVIEQALAREALRLGFSHHKLLTTGLRGVGLKDRGIDRMWEIQQQIGQSYLDPMNLNVFLGTGGLLSRAPRRSQSCLVLIDGFQTEGVTKLCCDSVFMIPHLGVLSTINQDIAFEIFQKDCLVHLGTCIAPKGYDAQNEEITVELTLPEKKGETVTVEQGSIKVIPLETGKVADVNIIPSRKWDVGAGAGHSLTKKVEGGVVGIVIDGRGRPLTLPENETKRRREIIEWFTALDMYPEPYLEKLMYS